MKITLEFDSFEDAEAPLVKAVLGTMSGGVAAPEVAPKKAEAAPKKAEAAPKKAEAAPKKAEAAPKKAEAASAEGAKEVQEASLMERAIELASQLMSDGNVRELRNQLSQVGASRVKSMDNEQLRSFISAVESLNAQ